MTGFTVSSELEGLQGTDLYGVLSRLAEEGRVVEFHALALCAELLRLRGAWLDGLDFAQAVQLADEDTQSRVATVLYAAGLADLEGVT